MFTLHGDNQGPLPLAKTSVNHQKSKHVDVKYHFIRSHVNSDQVDLRCVSTRDHIADVFTKAINKAKMSDFVKLFSGPKLV